MAYFVAAKWQQIPMAKPLFSVSQTVLRGESVWVASVSQRVTGKRHRLFAGSKADATRAANEFLASHQQFGAEGQINAQERALLARWRGRLSLDEMEHALRVASEKLATSGSKSILEAAELWLEEQKPGWKPRTLTGNRQQIGILCRDLGGVALADLTPDEIAQHIRARGASARNQWGVVAAFLRWCRTPKGWMSGNPMEQLRPPARQTKRKEVFTPEDLRALLEGSPAPFRRLIALQALAGLRHSEAVRAQVRDLDLAQGILYVGELKTSARGLRERYVTLPPAALAWLRASDLGKTGRVVGANERNTRRWIEDAKAIVGHWPHNVLRRSFGSHHLAAFQDAARTAALMGHTSAETTYSKYYRAIPQPVGAAWFGVFPLGGRDGRNANKRPAE